MIRASNLSSLLMVLLTRRSTSSFVASTATTTSTTTRTTTFFVAAGSCRSSTTTSTTRARTFLNAKISSSFIPQSQDWIPWTKIPQRFLTVPKIDQTSTFRMVLRGGSSTTGSSSWNDNPQSTISPFSTSSALSSASATFGSSSQQSTRMYSTSTTSSSTASSSITGTTTTSDDNNTNITQDNYNQDERDDATRAIQESMSIVGSNIVAATFGSVEPRPIPTRHSNDDTTTTTTTTGPISYFNTANMTEFRVLFVLGGPGAGKGTQCDLLTRHYHPLVIHLSVGDLLRAEQDRHDSPHRTMIQECLVSGKIVPVSISLALLRRAMEEHVQERGVHVWFLVDGFPRNYDNLHGWNYWMQQGITSVWGVLYFSCPLQVLERRILTRGETSGRSDDNIQSVQKRFHTFAQQTIPVVNTLRRVQELQQEICNTAAATTTTAASTDTCTMPLQIIDISGDETMEQVWEQVQRHFNQLLANDIWTANAQLIHAIATNDEKLYREVCVYMTAKEQMSMYEDVVVAMENEILEHREIPLYNPSIRFETGTIAVTSYDRMIHGQMIREERVWSQNGNHGWVNIHFTRNPLDQDPQDQEQ